MTKTLLYKALTEAPIIALQHESLYALLMILVYEGRATVEKTHKNASTFEVLK